MGLFTSTSASSRFAARMASTRLTVSGSSAPICIENVSESIESAMLTASNPAPLIAPSRLPAILLACNAPAM